MWDRRTDETESTEERRLLQLVQRMAQFRAGRRAVHIHLSDLRAYNRNGNQVRIAIHLFQSLVRNVEGQLFRLVNSDVVFVWRGGRIEVIDDAVTQLRGLFADDPLAREPEEDEESPFCTWYNLEGRYRDFLALVQRLHDAERSRRRRLATIAATESDARQSQLLPLSVERLRELEELIGRSDLSSMMRRQVVCAIAGGAPPKAMFRELYISIDELRDVVMPEYDLASDRWLFQHLTQTLDRRMLKMLMKNDDSAISKAFSVNLNVATLMSEQFLEFDASLRAATRCTVIVELHLLDILADLRAFYFARDFVRERGYRVCIDGLTDLTLPSVDFDRLGVDLAKMIWDADTLANCDEARVEELRAAVGRLGRGRMILCRCDSEDSVKVGQSLGINLFQGRHIERVFYAADAGFDAIRRLSTAARLRPAPVAVRARLRDRRTAAAV